MISLNGSQNPSSISFNGNNVNSVYFNGTKVWPESSGSIPITYKMIHDAPFEDDFHTWHSFTVNGSEYSSENATVEGTTSVESGMTISLHSQISRKSIANNPLDSEIVINDINGGHTAIHGTGDNDLNSVTYTYTVPSGVSSLNIYGTMLVSGIGPVQTLIAYLSVTES